MDIKKNILNNLISFATLVGLCLMLWGLFFLGSFTREESLKKGITSVLQKSSYAKNYHKVNIKRIKQIVSHSNAIIENIILEDSNKVEIEVYIIPMMGKYGIFEGLFVLDKKIKFCGIFVDDFSKGIEYYGISLAHIEIAKQKLITLKDQENEKQ